MYSPSHEIVVVLGAAGEGGSGGSIPLPDTLGD